MTTDNSDPLDPTAPAGGGRYPASPTPPWLEEVTVGDIGATLREASVLETLNFTYFTVNTKGFNWRGNVLFIYASDFQVYRGSDMVPITQLKVAPLLPRWWKLQIPMGFQVTIIFGSDAIVCGPNIAAQNPNPPNTSSGMTILPANGTVNAGNTLNSRLMIAGNNALPIGCTIPLPLFAWGTLGISGGLQMQQAGGNAFALSEVVGTPYELSDDIVIGANMTKTTLQKGLLGFNTLGAGPTLIADVNSEFLYVRYQLAMAGTTPETGSFLMGGAAALANQTGQQSAIYLAVALYSGTVAGAPVLLGGYMLGDLSPLLGIGAKVALAVLWGLKNLVQPFQTTAQNSTNHPVDGYDFGYVCTCPEFGGGGAAGADGTAPYMAISALPQDVINFKFLPGGNMLAEPQGRSGAGVNGLYGTSLGALPSMGNKF